MKTIRSFTFVTLSIVALASTLPVCANNNSVRFADKLAGLRNAATAQAQALWAKRPNFPKFQMPSLPSKNAVKASANNIANNAMVKANKNRTVIGAVAAAAAVAGATYYLFAKGFFGSKQAK